MSFWRLVSTRGFPHRRTLHTSEGLTRQSLHHGPQTMQHPPPSRPELDQSCPSPHPSGKDRGAGAQGTGAQRTRLSLADPLASLLLSKCRGSLMRS